MSLGNTLSKGWKMSRYIKQMSVLGLFVLVSTFFVGCSSNAKTGAAVGAGGGALVGQLIGGSTKSTLIGAGVGAAAGYIIGNEQDKN